MQSDKSDDIPIGPIPSPSPAMLDTGRSLSISPTSPRLAGPASPTASARSTTPLTPLEQISQSRKNSVDLASIKKRQLRQFYTQQNELIDQFEIAQHMLDKIKKEQFANDIVDDDAVPKRQSRHSVDTDEESHASKGVIFAIWTSFLCNVLLFGVKLSAVAITGSLAVLASTVDSALDLLSGSIIFLTHRSMKKKNIYKYPVGKKRYENLGIVVFAAVMGSAAFQIITQSVRQLTSGEQPEIPESLFAILSLCVVIATKFMLMLLCRYYMKESVSCEALAQDHRNDMLTNTVAVIMITVAVKTGLFWLDPAAAVMLSCWIIFNWVQTGHYHFQLLAGRAADPSFINQIIYFAAHFDERILLVDTVRAYHAGVRIIVECDIVLAPEISLKDSHDIGEALQKGIEAFPKVERAYVHCDYEFEHQPLTEHKAA